MGGEGLETSHLWLLSSMMSQLRYLTQEEGGEVEMAGSRLLVVYLFS